MNKRLRLLAPLMAVSLTAAACGDDDDGAVDTTAGAPDATTAPSGTTGATGAAPTAPGDTVETTAEPGTSAPGDTTATTGANGEDMMAIVRDDPLTGAEGSGLTRGVTDDSIKIGCVLAEADYQGFAAGATARFERANAEGGVNGRMIDFSSCQDSSNDPTQIQSLYEQAVEQDEVFGLLTVDAVIPQAAFDYLNENEVPYTGWGYLPGFCGTRWGFGWNGCIGGTQLTDAVPHAVNQLNLVLQTIEASGMEPADTRVFVQLDDGPAGRGNQETFTLAAQDAGATVVGSETNIPVATPPSDYTPFVQEALATDPNFVIVATAFANVGGYTAALKAAGFEGTILNYVAYLPGLLQSVPQLAQAIDGSYVSAQVLPQEQQTPFIKQIEEDLAAIEAETGTFITLGAGLGYYQADTMVSLLTAAGEDLNTQTFDEAVNGTGTTVDPGLEGAIGATTWPEMHFLPTDCAAVVQVEGEEFVVADEFRCFESVRIR